MKQAMMSQETSRMVYFAYIHSIMSYGIILGGNQPQSEKIFKIQKRVFRIITNSSAKDSCRELFKKLEIQPLYSQYIFSLSIFVIKNKHLVTFLCRYRPCYELTANPKYPNRFVKGLRS